MPLYLTLSRGPRADRAEPVLASSDPAVIRAVLAAIGTLADADAVAEGAGDVAGLVRLRPEGGSGEARS